MYSLYTYNPSLYKCGLGELSGLRAGWTWKQGKFPAEAVLPSVTQPPVWKHSHYEMITGVVVLKVKRPGCGSLHFSPFSTIPKSYVFVKFCSCQSHVSLRFPIPKIWRFITNHFKVNTRKRNVSNIHHRNSIMCLPVFLHFYGPASNSTQLYSHFQLIVFLPLVSVCIHFRIFHHI